MIRRFIAPAAAVVGLALPAVALAHSITVETVFHAFTPTGSPTIQTRAKSGYCYSGSLAIDRDDAWRCFVGNLLYDPCFSSAAASGVVVCPGLSVTSGIEIHLTKRLPMKSANSGTPSLRHEPWNIELANGRHFGFSSGASNVVDGRRLNYFCGTSCHSGLWGSPRRSTEPWTILYAPLTAKSLQERRAIRHVWM